MDQKVTTAKSPTAETPVFHKPCAFNPNGVSQTVCAQTTAVAMRNRGGCCKINCKSVARLCVACVEQGDKEPAVVPKGNHASGLCAWHTENGASARRPWKPYVPTMARLPVSASAPANRTRAEEFDDEEEGGEDTPSVVEQVKTEDPAEEEVAEVPPPTPRRFSRSVEEDGQPVTIDKSEITSTEEGRQILARVRKAVSEAVLEVVPVNGIRVMPNQPRRTFNTDRLRSLADSIKTAGQIQPGYLRRVDANEAGHTHELVDGERRWRAIQMAQIPTYRALVVDIDGEAAQYIVSIIANFNREGHTPLEIADAVRTMKEKLRLGLREIAESMGFSPIWVSNYYGLRRLVPEVRQMLDQDVVGSRVLPTQAAVDISRLPKEHQLPLARRVMNREVTVAGLRDVIRNISVQHNIPMRQVVVDPAVQRDRLASKITRLAAAAASLDEQLKGMHGYVFAGWNPGRKLAFGSQLRVAQEQVTASLRTFERLSKTVS